MRWAFRPRSLVTHGLVLVLGVFLGFAGLPIWRSAIMAIYQDEYGQLVEQCDGAMRDHFQAKMTAANAPSQETGEALYSAEVGLLVCQDYDLYQKKLIQWGLREDELAQMRLRAIEERASDLVEVVTTHEIRY